MAVTEQKRLIPLTADEAAKVLQEEQDEFSYTPGKKAFPSVGMLVTDGEVGVTLERFPCPAWPDKITTDVDVTANYVSLYVADDFEVEHGAVSPRGTRVLMTFRGLPDGGRATLALDDDTAAWLTKALAAGLAKRHNPNVPF
jgi:hypothetical protein